MKVLLFLLGFLMVAGLILDMIGTFTPGFIVYNSEYGPGWIFAYDFLKYKFRQGLPWVDVAAILIFFPVGCYLGMLIIFGVNTRLICNQGFTKSNRTPFYVIAGLALLVIVLIVACVIIVPASLNSYCDGYCGYTLGYSAWFCVASAGLSIGIIVISVYLARKKI